jgi:VanZ family protein
MAASNTSRIIGPLVKWLVPSISDETLLTVHFLVRKAAHFTEYAVLAVLASRAFAGSKREWLRRRWFAFAVGLVAVYSLSDEFHQTFVASRTGSIYDSMVDTAGGLAGAVVYWWRKGRRGERVKG